MLLRAKVALFCTLCRDERPISFTGPTCASISSTTDFNAAIKYQESPGTFRSCTVGEMRCNICVQHHRIMQDAFARAKFSLGRGRTTFLEDASDSRRGGKAQNALALISDYGLDSDDEEDDSDDDDEASVIRTDGFITSDADPDEPNCTEDALASFFDELQHEGLLEDEQAHLSNARGMYYAIYAYCCIHCACTVHNTCQISKDGSMHLDNAQHCAPYMTRATEYLANRSCNVCLRFYPLQLFICVFLIGKVNNYQQRQSESTTNTSDYAYKYENSALLNQLELLMRRTLCR